MATFPTSVALLFGGMPALTLTDIAAARLEAISFFLMGLLACAWLIQRLLKSLAPQLAALPRLTHPRAIVCRLPYALQLR